MKITKIPRKRDQHKKRVAAYCRVSTLKDEQEESIETQKAYYANFIASHDDWEFAGIYSDEKSGTKAQNRPGFQKLIRDALDGAVDFILVKSISRFSRNIVDAQRYIKRLHGNGVDIWFEKEGLNTADPSCSMMLSFLSTIAQDESRSISENVKWAYRERFKRGEYNLGNNRVLGYDSIDGKLVPNEAADMVRGIFQMYLEGKGLTEITNTLDQMGVVGRNGKPLTVPGILYILGNEVYVGDKILQKRAPKNYLTKQPEKNAHFESNYLTGDHEGIINREEWNAVQLLLNARRTDINNGIRYHGGKTHFLYGKVFCEECGSPMTRRTLTGYGGGKYKAWVCRDRHMGRKGNGCKMRTIREDELLSEIRRVIGTEAAENTADLIERVDVGMEGMDVTAAQVKAAV
nr:recombinase family protein [Clostridia bacterium]